jgi:hypothetical protein
MSIPDYAQPREPDPRPRSPLMDFDDYVKERELLTTLQQNSADNLRKNASDAVLSVSCILDFISGTPPDQSRLSAWGGYAEIHWAAAVVLDMLRLVSIPHVIEFFDLDLRPAGPNKRR